ncbi:FkbM family methyltransferase [Thioalkalivibrio sp. ALE14]|uniref:FkbM family methyltransferase n=1 Tax=Thioalkalivibrio sp. ALE14 TaxID=1158168 RepID=UPI0009D978CE|nr:FkbM family methyltransferase [Thioalkalivibrio sp. ALE14]
MQKTQECSLSRERFRELLSPSSPLKRELKIGDTFIDVGANHGSFSLAASEIVGKTGLVVAFEPQPILADLIKKTLSENDLAQEKVFQYACGNAEECRQIFVPRGSSGRASLFKGYTKGELVECSDIKLVKLDSALEGFDLPGNVLLKIDVEGSEMDALAGARETIARYHPFILMEMNAGAIEAAGTSADSFMDFLSGFGYTRFYRLQAPHERYPLAEIRSRASSKKDDIVVY